MTDKAEFLILTASAAAMPASVVVAIFGIATGSHPLLLSSATLSVMSLLIGFSALRRRNVALQVPESKPREITRRAMPAASEARSVPGEPPPLVVVGGGKSGRSIYAKDFALTQPSGKEYATVG